MKPATFPVAPSAPIYADFAATTPCDPVVANVIYEALQGFPGNANANSGSHYYGIQAQAQLREAQTTIAGLLNAPRESIVFTSGATESNYLALLGLARGYRKQGNHLITIATEHKATLNPLRALAQEDFSLTTLGVNAQGEIDLDALRAAITSDTILLSLSAVNNETGVMPDLSAIADICREKGVHWHIDAAQAFAKIPLDVAALGCDTLSISGHKIYGPKGVGVLYVRQKPKARLADVFAGGSQGLRPGTPPLPLITGLASAASRLAAQQEAHTTMLRQFRERLITGLQQKLSALPPLPGTTGVYSVLASAASERQFPGIISLHIPGVRSVAIMQLLAQYVALSSGSACNTSNPTPSHVLKAMGLSDQQAAEVLRVSVSHTLCVDDIEQITDYLSAAIMMLRYLPEASD